MKFILSYIFSYKMEVYPSREHEIRSYIFSYSVGVYPSRDHEIHSAVYILL